MTPHEALTAILHISNRTREPERVLAAAFAGYVNAELGSVAMALAGVATQRAMYREEMTEEDVNAAHCECSVRLARAADDILMEHEFESSQMIEPPRYDAPPLFVSCRSALAEGAQ